MPGISRKMRWWLAKSYQHMDMTTEAVTEFEKTGRFFEVQVALGNIEAARQILEDEIESEGSRGIPLSTITLRYAALRDTDKVFEWLEKAYDERSPWLSYIKTHPDFDVIRDDSRYTSLLRKMGLE